MPPTIPEQRFIFRTCRGGRQVLRISPYDTKTSSILTAQKAAGRRFGGIDFCEMLKIAMPDPVPSNL